MLAIALIVFLPELLAKFNLIGAAVASCAVRLRKRNVTQANYR
jgi:hypothetical protein